MRLSSPEEVNDRGLQCLCKEIMRTTNGMKGGKIKTDSLRESVDDMPVNKSWLLQ